MTEDELRKEHAEIRKLNAATRRVRPHCGVEADIRVDRRLDCGDDLLRACDAVVASIHSAFQRGRTDQTARLIVAIQHSFVDIIAHPTGRCIGKRDGYEIDLGALLDAAACRHRARGERPARPARPQR